MFNHEPIWSDKASDPDATWGNLFYPPKKNDYAYFQSGRAFDSRGIEYSPVNASWMADAAMLAYGRYGSTPIPPFEFSTILRTAGFEHIGLIGNWSGATDGTQGFFAGNSQFAVVAFRGTEKDDWLDLAADALALPARPEMRSRSGLVGSLVSAAGRFGDLLLDSGEPVVHGGFRLALDAVWPEVASWLAGYRAAHPQGRLCFTGHSLGGALATLAAGRFDSRPAALYTFGSPRVGNASFVATVEAATEGCVYRFVNGSDLVTTVPPELWRYRHIPESPFHLTAPGEVRFSSPTAMSWSEITRVFRVATDAVANLAVQAEQPPRELVDHSPARYAFRVGKCVRG